MMKGKTNIIFYKCGIVLFFLGLAAAVFLLCGGRKLLPEFSGCVFKQITGIYCPGCGGTRACLALLACKPLKSFCYHPAVLYFFVVYVVFMCKMFLLKHFGLGEEQEGRLVYFIYIGIGVILLQWIVKLVCQLGFHFGWI